MHNSKTLTSFNYLGGKTSLIPWLLPILDVDCKHFVDVCGGSGVVMLNRKPAAIETYNDINKKVVNFFQVLRDDAEGLIRLLELTPHSRDEYENAWHDAADSPVEQARKFFIRTQQSIMAAGAQDQMKGWASAFTESRCTISEKTNKWVSAVPKLWAVAERFKMVQIECRDFRYIMKKYDSPGALLYIDSPYDPTYRSSTKYEFDFGVQDFYDMQYWAKAATGKVAISSYRTEFMMELFSDFKLHVGPKRFNARSTKEAIECVFTNY